MVHIPIGTCQTIAIFNSEKLSPLIFPLVNMLESARTGTLNPAESAWQCTSPLRYHTNSKELSLLKEDEGTSADSAPSAPPSTER